MTTNTGGPAFPRNILDHGHGLLLETISLRDYFAAKAMQSELVGGVHPDNFDVTAKRAYHMADAMLKAREQK
jgi:hypothetical protein